MFCSVRQFNPKKKKKRDKMSKQTFFVILDGITKASLVTSIPNVPNSQLQEHAPNILAYSLIIRSLLEENAELSVLCMSEW